MIYIPGQQFEVPTAQALRHLFLATEVTASGAWAVETVFQLSFKKGNL